MLPGGPILLAIFIPIRIIDPTSLLPSGIRFRFANTIPTKDLQRGASGITLNEPASGMAVAFRTFVHDQSGSAPLCGLSGVALGR